MVVRRYELMLLGGAWGVSGFLGIHERVCFGLEFTTTSHGRLALLWILPHMFEFLIFFSLFLPSTIPILQRL